MKQKFNDTVLLTSYSIQLCDILYMYYTIRMYLQKVILLWTVYINVPCVFRPLQEQTSPFDCSCTSFPCTVRPHVCPPEKKHSMKQATIVKFIASFSYHIELWCSLPWLYWMAPPRLFLQHFIFRQINVKFVSVYVPILTLQLSPCIKHNSVFFVRFSTVKYSLLTVPYSTLLASAAQDYFSIPSSPRL